MSAKNDTTKVQWRAGKVRVDAASDEPLEDYPVWQLSLNGRVLLTAISMDPLAEAVSKEDRRLIGEALVEMLGK